MNARNLHCAALLVMTLGAALAANAQMQLSSEFTYQGRLLFDGVPVNGATDFRFTLLDSNHQIVAGPMAFSPAGGTAAPINVFDGLFTATLDFSVEVFDGEARLLSIEVRHPSGVGSWTQLPGLQPVHAAPYALQTRGIFVTADQRVGLGTTNPQTPFALRGNGGTNDVGITQNAFGGGSTMELTTADGASDQASRVVLRGGSDHANVEFLRGGRGVEEITMVIEGSSGFVGIGTANPSALLDVDGAAKADSVSANAITTNDLDVSGTLSADALLAESGDISAQRGNETLVTRRLELQGARTGNAVPFAEIEFRNFDNSESQEYAGARITSSRTGAGNGDLRFSTSFGGTLGEAMRITDDGYVGIGVTNPSRPLDVAADVNEVAHFASSASIGTWINFGNTSAGGRDWRLISTGADNGEGAGKLLFKAGGAGAVVMTLDEEKASVPVLQITGGSDIAEPFNVRGEVEARPGMVVALDRQRVGELRVADRAYDRTVAGIISGANGVKPGLTLTQEGSIADGEHPVALTGRVWCLVDADANGAVGIGDLLTTSATPGHAMRVSDHERAAGAVLGKAMSSLERGRGYVLVLVSLQ